MKKKIKSPAGALTKYNIPSLLKSAGICVTAFIAIYLLQLFFPELDIKELKTGVLALSTAWIINLLKEIVEEK